MFEEQDIGYRYNKLSITYMMLILTDRAGSMEETREQAVDIRPDEPREDSTSYRPETNTRYVVRSTLL